MVNPCNIRKRKLNDVQKQKKVVIKYLVFLALLTRINKIFQFKLFFVILSQYVCNRQPSKKYLHSTVS